MFHKICLHVVIVITQASFQLFECRVLQTEISEASHHTKMNYESVANVIKDLSKQ